MRTIKILGIIIFGIFVFSSISGEYLSTDIAKGYSWRYQRIEQGYNRIIDFKIDSVWGNPSDTLFFWVSERDSVNYTHNTIDTVYIQNDSVLCRKANRVTQCDNITISKMFNDQLNARYDSISPNSNSSFSHPIGIDFSQEQYTGLQIGYYSSGVGTHMGFSKDTSLFSDHIGLLRERYEYGGGYSTVIQGFTITLLSYNGKDVSYSCGVKSLYFRKSINSASLGSYNISFDRSNPSTSFNLLGRQSVLPTSTYGLRISRLSLQQEP